MLVKSASDADDSKAKQFAPDATKAIVYVYRDDSFLGGDITSNVFLNDNSVAEGARSRFNVLSLPPGHYVLTSTSNDSGALPALLHNRDKPPVELTVESGKLYFVHETWEGIKGFFLVTATREEAEQAIKKGKLIAVHQL
jgi:hypothetical protein